MSVRQAEKTAAAQPTVHGVPENGAARREGDPEVAEQEKFETAQSETLVMTKQEEEEGPERERVRQKERVGLIRV